MRLDNNLTAINIKKKKKTLEIVTCQLKKTPRGVKPTITETFGRTSKRKKFLKF